MNSWTNSAWFKRWLELARRQFFALFLLPFSLLVACQTTTPPPDPDPVPSVPSVPDPDPAAWVPEIDDLVVTSYDAKEPYYVWLTATYQDPTTGAWIVYADEFPEGGISASLVKPVSP